MIELEQVTKVFGGTTDPAVDSLDLAVPRGELVVLVGPSGCGKTTTLKMINRIVEPTSGTITIDGQDQRTRPGYALRRDIGYVIQQIGLFPHKTIERNIATVPRLLGWETAAISARVEQLRELFADDGIAVLEPTGAQNSNVFVTTAEFADEHGLSAVSDLADAGDIVFGGPPECEGRDTCFVGLQEVYGLDNVSFESIQEAAARLIALEQGQNQLTLLFSTDAPLAGDDLVALEDDQGMIPPENIVPVLRDEILDAYGDDLRGLMNSISAQLSVEDLREANQLASEGLAPDEIAAEWLADVGIVD